MKNKYFKSIIKNQDKKENFLVGTYISFLVVLIIAIITNYQIGNIQLVYYESVFALLTVASFAYYLHSKRFLFSVYSLVAFVTLISYVLLIEVGYKLALFHVIVPLNYFFLFSLRRALIITALHEFIVCLIYIFGYMYQDGVSEVLYDGNILSIIIASLVIIFFGIIYHVTIEKSYVALEVASHQKEILLTEIHHRIKNNLQMISSMIGLQQATLKEPNVNKILEKSRRRIQSIATVHETLYGHKNFEEIMFEEYITKLVNNISNVNVNVNDIDIVINGDNVFLTAEDILKLGIITNELLTNSIKHAFTDDIKVEISLYENSDHLIYIYNDNGTKEIEIKTDDTLGYKIISLMVGQMTAELSLVTKKGLLFELKIPK